MSEEDGRNNTPPNRSPPVVDYHEEHISRSRSRSRSPLASSSSRPVLPKFVKSYKRQRSPSPPRHPQYEGNRRRSPSPPPRVLRRSNATYMDQRSSVKKHTGPVVPNRDNPDSYNLMCPCGHGYYLEYVSTTTSNNCVSVKYECKNRKGGCGTIRDMIIRPHKGMLMFTM